MRINSEMVIKIGDFDDYKEQVLKHTDKSPPYKRIMVLEAHKLYRIFTVERIRLLKAINEHPEYGTVKLSGLLGRKQEAISRDLTFLRALGMITDEMPIKIPSNKPVSLNIMF